MANWIKPLRSKHIFVVLRHDEAVADVVDSITGTKGFAYSVDLRLVYD